MAKAFNDKPFSYHEELNVEIQSLSNDGRGIARVNSWIVMVPFVLPGEQVRVRIFKNNKNYSEADLMEILQASSHRIQASCPLFGQCAGCQYQHMHYEQQLLCKQQQIKDGLQRIGKISVPVNPVHASSKIFGYRTKITPHFERKEQESFPIGFLSYGRKRQWVDIPNCPIASEAINKVLPAAREHVRKNLELKTGTLLLRDCQEGVVTDPKRKVHTQVGDCKFGFYAGSFFQNNPFILESIINYLKNLLKETLTISYLIDAYCGVGVFGISLAKYLEHFVGIEVDARSIELAEENRQFNHTKNGTFQAGDAESIFKEIDFPNNKTLVLMDPPRKGCSESFLQQLVQFKPAHIAYISCAPDTQARDLQRLLTLDPSYHILSVQPFDMFPQTRHVECVVSLSR